MYPSGNDTQEVAVYLIRLSQKSPRLEHPCVCSCTSNQLCINLTCALAAHAPSRWTHVPLHLHLFPEEPRVCASTSWLLPPRIWPMAGLWRQYRRWRSSKHGCARASASPSELHKCAWVWNSCSRFSPPPLWFSISHTHTYPNIYLEELSINVLFLLSGYAKHVEKLSDVSTKHYRKCCLLTVVSLR